MSTSEYWRLLGNDTVKATEKISMQNGWEDKMKEAIGQYQKASNTALDDDEKASASKNIAIVALKIADSVSPEPQNENNIMEKYAMALKEFSSALEYGKKSIVKGKDWLANIEKLFSKTNENALNYLKNLAFESQHLCTIGVLLAAMPKSTEKQELQNQLVEACLKNARIALDADNYKSSMDYIKRCEGLLAELERTTADESKLDGLRKDTKELHMLTEALRCITKGDACLGECKDKTKMLEAVWQAVDFYQNAVQSAENISIELEARAQSRMGRAFYLALDWLERARKNFHSSMNLINSADLKDVKTKGWYREMTTLHMKAQQDSYIKEEMESQDIHQHILKDLDSELKFIDKKSEAGPEVLLQYVYERYPPKHLRDTVTLELEANDKQSLKKALKKGACHYHPDRIDERKHGQRYKIMFREIAKRINNHHEEQKREDSREQ